MTATAPPRRRHWTQWVSLLARLVAGGLLVFSGAVKIRTLAGFVNSVKAYVLFPDWVSEIIGTALPFVEVLLGLMLLAGLFTRWAALAEVLLMAVFIAGIASLWARGMKVDCGCFGPSEPGTEFGPSYYLGRILEDVGFMIPGLWLIARPRSPFSVDDWLNRDVDALSHDPLSDDTDDED